MLFKDFYTTLKYEITDNTVNALISFNKNHKIFKGHFPGLPVVPGVCMMQIVRELMERAIETKLKITEGDNLKFLSVINPELQEGVNVTINFKHDYNRSDINASMYADNVTFFKFKGTLTKFE